MCCNTDSEENQFNNKLNNTDSEEYKLNSKLNNTEVAFGSIAYRIKNYLDKKIYFDQLSFIRL